MFTLTRRTAIFRAELSSPLFHAFHQAWQLQEALFEILSPHRVTAADIRLERRDGEPSCTANVLSLGMVVSVRLTHLEVFFLELDDVDAVRGSVLNDILARLAALTDGFRLYSLALDHHGTLQGTSPSAFISRWVTPPAEGLGPLTASSAAFYYGPSEARAATSIHLEHSSMVAGGLFVKTSSVFSADGMAVDAVLREATAASARTLAVLGLLPATEPAAS